MSRTIVGVLRGGVSDGYASSLRTGAALVQALPEEDYDVRDILIDHLGLWHVRGIPVAPMRALSGLDVAVNALYNDGIGSDGAVARALKQSSVPYTGTRAAVAALARNRTWMRSALSEHNVRLPRAYAFTVREDADTAGMAQRVFTQFGPPYVVKPVATGTAIGIRIVPTLHDLPDALADVLDQYGSALVEEFIRGPHLSVGVIEGFRNEALYALPPAEFVLPGSAKVADFAARTHESASHTCPWCGQAMHKNTLMNIARTAHRGMGLSHYSRADFVLRGEHVYLVGVNAFPELYDGSAFASMLETVGAPMPLFVKHIIDLARA